MDKIIKDLIGKRLSVYVGGEFERITDFIGLTHLLVCYSDFYSNGMNKKERESYFKKSIKYKQFYIDQNIIVKFK